jgi:ATP-dependent DNA ligase
VSWAAANAAIAALHRPEKFGIGKPMEWRAPRRPALLPAGFVEPCLPSVRATAPCGRECVHEIKHDGYRLIVRRDGKRARVFTRRGFDWIGRFPWIEDALHSLGVRSATIDGEAVWCREDGLSIFEACQGWLLSNAGRVEALPHENVLQVTMDRYGHLFPSEDHTGHRDSARTMD